MIVLGFTFWKGSHDSSAAIVRDGALIAAAEEERFTRTKHDGRVPVHSIDYCLSAAGIEMRDVSVIAYPDRPYRTGRNSQLAEMQTKTLEAMVESGDARRRSLLHKRVLDAGINAGIAPDAGIHPMVSDGFRELAKRYGALPPVRYYGHHLAHAAAAYLTSGFDDAAVVTIDGRGGPLSAATWNACASTIDVIDEEPYTNSLGWFYRDCTRYAGLGDFGEGKLMGLAPYGDSSTLRETVDQLLNTNGSRWFEYRNAPTEELAGFAPRGDEGVLAAPYPDFAAAVQNALERGYRRAVQSAMAKAQSGNLCVGGGVALNCSANGEILASGVARDMWLFPASGDAGLSVGAALLAARDMGDSAGARVSSPYWGPEFDDDAIEVALSREQRVTFSKPEHLATHVAEAIAFGSVAGWFQGRMELGPRALGNRSILADPRTTAMRDKVNRVKGREAWRPLAPSILDRKTKEYFEVVPPNSFMLFATQARDITKKVAPAIVHVDGSARPQPVSVELNPRFHELLTAFDRLTGVPILLNTSFNAAGEPIVCTPDDALRTFLDTELDLLVMGSFVVKKR